MILLRKYHRIHQTYILGVLKKLIDDANKEKKDKRLKEGIKLILKKIQKKHQAFNCIKHH